MYGHMTSQCADQVEKDAKKQTDAELVFCAQIKNYNNFVIWRYLRLLSVTKLQRQAL